MMLHTERATRGQQRAFVRYADLLDDWTQPVFALGEKFDLQAVKTAMAVDIAEVHRFIDPSLRRVTMTWDDIGVPDRLRELADETWQALDEIATDDTEKTREWCDQLRTAYAAQYAEAEAFAHSTVVAQRRSAAAERAPRGGRGRAGPQRRRPDPARRAGDGAAGRPPEAAPGDGPGATGPDARHRRAGGGFRLRRDLAVDLRRAPRAGADLRLPGAQRGAQPAVGAAADLLRRRPRAPRRQRLRRRHRRRREAGRGAVRRGRPAHRPRLPARGRPGRRRAPRDARPRASTRSRTSTTGASPTSARPTR